MPGGSGVKRAGTVGPMRINTVRRHNRQASAEAVISQAITQSPLSAKAVDEIFDAYSAVQSPTSPLPAAPVLANRRRTIIEQMVVMLEQPASSEPSSPLETMTDSPPPEPVALPMSISSISNMSNAAVNAQRTPTSLMALFDGPSGTASANEDLPQAYVIAPNAGHSDVPGTPLADSPDSSAPATPPPVPSKVFLGQEHNNSAGYSTSLQSIRDQDEASNTASDAPTLGDIAFKGSQNLQSRADSSSEMSAKQLPAPDASPKGEKKKGGLGNMFSKRKKSEGPPSVIPQSLHGQSSGSPQLEARERSKTSEPNSGKSLFARMRKTNSASKIDVVKVTPEVLVPEEKISSEFVPLSAGEPVAVEGGGGSPSLRPQAGTQPAPVIHRRSAAGPRIQTIVHELEEETAARPIPQRQYESIELLNDRAVARTTKPLFEERSELRTDRPELRKSFDNLQVDKKSRLTAEIFSFGKKKKPDGLAASGSIPSLGPPAPINVSIDQSPRSLAVSSPQVTSPMHAMSGGVAIRKSKPPLCVLTKLSGQAGGLETPSPVSSVPTAAKEHRRTPSRNFKDWYTKYAQDAVKRRLEDVQEEREFADPITLEFIFGSKLSGPKDAVHSFAKASRCFENSRRDPKWDHRGTQEAPDVSKSRDEEHMALVDDIASKYRPLDIFHDGKLKNVTYSHSAHGPVLDIIVAGKCDDLLDALVFPLEQDMSYAEVFLATYRFYMPSSLLMDSLIEWYNVDIDPEAVANLSPSSDSGQSQSASHERPHQEAFLKKHRKHIQSRVVRVLMMWIKNHWHDFQEDGTLFRTLQALVDHISSIGFGDGQKLSQAVREQRLSWYTTQYIPAFPPKRNHMLDNTKPWALLWEPEDFAKDLTFIDHFLFRQVRPDAYLHVLARPVSLEGAGRNVPLKVLLEYINWFRLVGSYTATTVLQEDNPKKRARAIKHLIKIAKGVSTKHIDVFMGLGALMDPADEHANYWVEFEKARQPAIPFLGCYMRDMLEIHQEAPMYLDAVSPAGQGISIAWRARRKSLRTPSPGYDLSDSDAPAAPLPDQTAGDPPEPTLAQPDEGEYPDYAQWTIHFQKYYDLYAVAAELEMYRVGSAMYPPSADKDAGSLLLTHMRDVAIRKDSGLWADDVLAEKSGINNTTLSRAAGNGGGDGGADGD
ncbi:Son of sevenless 2 [Geranomyces michiganensis]|nr:Son of sevenless 2 [Geranomyces michiganensis]